MSSALLKFMGRHQQIDGQQLHWGRVDADGMPFRGNVTPMYTEDEYDENVVEMKYPHNREFDTNDPEQNQEYLKVLDGIVHGFYQCLFIDRWRDPQSGHYRAYVEWAVRVKEDVGRLRHNGNGVSSHGPMHRIGNPG